MITPSKNWTERAREISKILCAVAVIFPILSTAGWIFKFPILKQGHPALPAMPPNTIFGLFLSATAVLLARKVHASRRQTLTSLYLGTIVMALGAITLIEYFITQAITIDTLLVEIEPTPLQPFPGRPSPQSAANFLTLGLSILVINRPRSSAYIWQLGAIAVIGNSLAALTGYLFSSQEFYGFPIYMPAMGMAVNTALSFVLLGIGLLCSRPDQGMMTLAISGTRTGHMTRIILLASLLAPPILGVITRVGVIAGWYDQQTHIAVFLVSMIGILLFTLWRTARLSEREELRSRSAYADAKLANENLKKVAEEREVFTSLIDNSSDFIGICRSDGTTSYINQAGRRMVGLDPDFSVTTTRFSDFYPEKYRLFASEVIGRSVDEKGYWKGETFLRDWKTSREIPVSDTHFKIIEPSTRRILGTGTVCRDISDIQRERIAKEAAIDELRDSNVKLDLARRKFLGLLEAAPDAMFVCDARGTIEISNAQCEVLLGYNRAEIIGQKIEHFLLEDHRSTFLAQLATILDQDAPQKSELVSLFAVKKNGLGIPIEISLSPFETADGILITCSIRDMTARQRAEQELTLAKKAADAASYAKSVFLASMSHEIRTPLGVILGYADMLLLHSDSANQVREYAQAIQRNSHNLSALIGDILDLSKIESGKFETKVSSVRLVPFLKEIISQLQLKASQKNLTLSLKFSGPVPQTIETDELRLRQIVMNIVGNAIKFTEQGNVTVVVKLESPDSKALDRTLEIVVRDTGVGIAYENLPKIFQPFTQAEHFITRKYGGTGLGLTISREMARALGGDLTVVESEIGKGSTFRITVSPGNVDSASVYYEESPDLKSSTLSKELKDPLLKDVRILVVEDFEDNQRLLKALLQHEGAIVELANDGEEGIKKALAGTFDVVLMDIQMPVLNGYLATTKLRTLGYKLPIIALTANAMKGEAERCLEAGFSDYLAKPIDRTSLSSKVNYYAHLIADEHQALI